MNKTIPLNGKKPFKTKKNILCLMDYGINTHTGFSTVAVNVKAELKKQFGDSVQLDIVACNHFAPDGSRDYLKANYVEEDGTNVISAELTDAKNDPFGRHIFLKLLKDNEYDGVFILQDLGAIQPIIQIIRDLKFAKKKANKKQFKSFFYFPVDTKLIRPLIRDIEFFDVLATYTEYGKEQILALMPDLRTKIKVIPHGTNTRDFYPMPDSESLKFRSEYFENGNMDKFIITNVNRNQPRKDIPSTIFAFIEAKKIWKNQKRKPFLYLHMHPKDPLGWDIRGIMLQTDLKEYEDYMLTPKHIENHEADIATLRNIYNASDLFLTTTLAEGWGLTGVEAMACKLPAIFPMNTSLTEISDDGRRAFPLRNTYPFCSKFDNIIRDQCDIYEAAEAIVEMERRINCGEEKDMVDAAYLFSHSLTWEYVCKKMGELFYQTF